VQFVTFSSRCNGARPIAEIPADLGEGARLESDRGETHEAIRKHFIAQSIQRYPRKIFLDVTP
jgi:hypothetical protein